MKRYFSFVLVFLISTNLYSQFSGGTGTANNPYQIKSRQDMEALADSVDNIDNWSKGKYFKLIYDITDSVRTVIGYTRNAYEYEHCFQGDFNGNNKKITLAVDGKWIFSSIDNKWDLATRNFIGLSSALYKAKIYNLAIDGYVKGEANLGGVCGYAENSNIYNCKNYCNITVDETYSNQAEHVGGICGYSYYNYCISNCINYGNIKSFIDRIGGIVGEGIASIITNCSNYGTITSKGSYSKSSYVGGIGGEILIYHSNDTFSNCHNYGNVSGEHAVGGITGCIANLIHYDEEPGLPCVLSYCTNAGTVTATSAAGGITGHTHKETGISHCINIGTVRGDSVVGGIASGYDNIVETNNGSINNCHNAGFVIGNNIVGGIQGRCWGEIHNSLNTGVVVGNTNAGGIAGETNNTAIIQNCYYDKQMCIHGGIAGNNIAGQAEGYLTKKLIGNNLQAKLGSADWTFDNANLYPTLKHFENDSIAFVASSPVYLYDSDVADFDRQNKVRTDFKVNLENAVKWNRIIGNVDIVNDDGVLKSNGSDTLVASIGNYKKLVPINIELLPIGDVKFTIWATEHKQIAPTETNYSIPIYIKSNAKTLQEVAIKKLVIEIDKNIFYAKHSDNGTLASKNQNEITIENIKIPPLNAGEEVVLFNIIGDMLLGNIDSSGIIINQNIELSEILTTKPDLKNGYITLNICREGSDRFVQIVGNSPSLAIKNNVVNDVLEVECNVVESGRYTLEVVDMAGLSVKVEEFVAGGAGAFLFEIDVVGFGVGRYMVVMGAPSGRRYSGSWVKG